MFRFTATSTITILYWYGIRGWANVCLANETLPFFPSPLRFVVRRLLWWSAAPIHIWWALTGCLELYETISFVKLFLTLIFLFLERRNTCYYCWQHANKDTKYTAPSESILNDVTLHLIFFSADWLFCKDHWINCSAMHLCLFSKHFRSHLHFEVQVPQLGDKGQCPKKRNKVRTGNDIGHRALNRNESNTFDTISGDIQSCSFSEHLCITCGVPVCWQKKQEIKYLQGMLEECLR